MVKLPELRKAREELRKRADDLRKAGEEMAKRSQELRRLGDELRKSARVREEIVTFRKEFQRNMVTFLTGALAFVFALTWNDLIKETIIFFVPPSKELFYRYATAIIVTFVVIFVLYILSKFKSKD